MKLSPLCPQHTFAKSLTDVQRASFGECITNTHTFYPAVLFHFLSHRVWLHSFAFPWNPMSTQATNTCEYSQRKINSLILIHTFVLRVFCVSSWGLSHRKSNNPQKLMLPFSWIFGNGIQFTVANVYIWIIHRPKRWEQHCKTMTFYWSILSFFNLEECTHTWFCCFPLCLWTIWGSLSHTPSEGSGQQGSPASFTTTGAPFISCAG